MATGHARLVNVMAGGGAPAVPGAEGTALPPGSALRGQRRFIRGEWEDGGGGGRALQVAPNYLLYILREEQQNSPVALLYQCSYS